MDQKHELVRKLTDATVSMLYRRCSTHHLARIFAVAVLVGALVWSNTAFADPGNSGATISGSFSDSCRNFETVASKDISHVEISYLDGRMMKDEDVDNHVF